MSNEAAADGSGDVMQAADVASDAGADASAVVDSGVDGESPDATLSPDAGDGGADSDADAAAVPLLPDAGAGCVPSGEQSMLSAAAEGLPSSGLVLWLRADRGIYMLQTDAAPTSSSDAGIPGVCAWLDQSGQGWLLGNGGTAPAAWLDGGVGGQAAVHFSAGANPLGTSGVLNLGPTSARTFVAVEALVDTDGRFEPIEQGQGGTGGIYLSIDANTWQTQGNREGVYVTDNSYDSDLATSSGTPRLHVLTISTMTVGSSVPAALSYRVDGVARTLTVVAANGGNDFEDFSGADFTQVGGTNSTSSTGAATDALLAEVLVYNRALEADEVQELETALEARYGINSP